MAVPKWQKATVVSGRICARLLQASEGPLEVSLDLGRSRCSVHVRQDGIELPDGTAVEKSELAQAWSDPEDCIHILNGRCRLVYDYDPALRKYYKLYQPFQDRPPTVIINGATMHTIVELDPWEGARRKVDVVPDKGGECFDTCCGLGYSAQMLAGKRFSRVLTCEIDRNVLHIAAINPWSEDLFRAGNIEVRRQDLRDCLAECDEELFGCVFHDPPTIQLAGELYSQALYQKFARVLAPGGVLYHYVGTPGARRGRDYARGVIQRLQEAGFVRARRVEEGVLAYRRRHLKPPPFPAPGRPA